VGTPPVAGTRDELSESLLDEFLAPER
jgi:hypothetical protein